MSIICYTGLPGSGKTTAIAKTALQCLKRDEKIYKKTGKIRKLYTNIKFSREIETLYAEYIEYFNDIYKMPEWKQCDIFIDELSTYFDAHEWEALPKQIKRYLKLHRHYNVMIYGVAQDFLTIDKSFRRLTAELINVQRLIGSKEPSPYDPPAKYPFLISLNRTVDIKFWEFEKEMYQYISSEYEIYTKSDFSIFDTTQELPDQPPPPLKKEIRICPEDGFRRVRYR